MGSTVLDKGLRPLSERERGATADVQLEWLWIMVNFHASRYRGRPIAEVLASWTNVLLIHKGFNPTIGDIAKASGLPRPTVSRYVSNTIRQGWAEERVNSKNRRRRELHLTAAGERELEFIVQFFHEMYQELIADQPPGSELVSGSDYLDRMQRMTEKIAAGIEPIPADLATDRSSE
ncbi:MAG: MarR family winged helix-turn-helix transcriptional regulator [Gammaproteobacteria bacterium]